AISDQRPARYTREADMAVRSCKLVVVDDGLQDLGGQCIDADVDTAGNRRATVDPQFGLGREERDLELARGCGFDRHARELVECDAEVLDLFDVESEATRDT